MRLAVGAVVLALMAISAPQMVRAQTASAGACEALAALASPQLKVEAVQTVPAGPMKLPFGPPSGIGVDLPEHCLFRAVMGPRIGVGGQAYGIGFEVRMPTHWNERFLFQGGGGLDGAIQPAIGMTGAEPALTRGFAVVSTDAGHEGADASFAADQQARLDYAYRALGKVTVEAKAIITRFYGQPPRWSYFVGCSNGGRQGMLAADRYPLEFDGVVAGDPGFRLSRAAVAEAWDTAALDSIAPKDAQGRPIVAEALTPEDLKILSDGVLAQCDALDGLKDGMINDIKGCRFDPSSLTCKEDARARCLTAAKVAVIKRIFNGAHDSAGRPLYSGWPYDAGVAGMDWRNWKMGSSPTGTPNGINQTLGQQSLALYFSTPPDPSLNADTYDFDHAAQMTAQTGAINDPTSTFLTSFVQHGGRLLIYQGLSDPVFSADDIMDWYDELAMDSGSPQAWARLFLVPGMNHCMGGPATDHFDALAAIQAWVEEGKAPDRIIATGAAFPGASRPLCAYPNVARYRGGDPAAAGSFACEQ